MENKVYIVLERVDYEGDDILAVFDSEESAKKEVNQQETYNEYADVSYIVKEYMVLA